MQPGSGERESIFEPKSPEFCEPETQQRAWLWWTLYHSYLHRSLAKALKPGLQVIDRGEQDDGENQKEQRDSCGTCIVVLFELADDQKRRDFGNHGNIAGDEDHGTVFTDRAPKGQRATGQYRRHQLG